MEHVSVLKNDVEKLLELKKGEIVVDATLGLGGHAMMLLKNVGKTGKLIAFEQDERNLKEAKKRIKEFAKEVKNVFYISDNFRYLKKRITEIGIEKIDAILFDLGLSSPHIDDSNRGFSFLNDGPLDMRFDERNPLTAEIVVNEWKEEDLVKIFYEYGEEKYARKIAREICSHRKAEKFTSTLQLANFIEVTVCGGIGKRWKEKIHPATRVFQALRIAVNDELKALSDALDQAAEMLNIGGRIAVISYHSLEDRIVKQFFKELQQPQVTMEESIYRNHGDPIFEPITRKPIVPTDEEIEQNRRSRSAKLRVYKKVRELPQS
ncbi:16S rRNA (cytosine(1402)-N(4))-methyltransferase RsmH [Candidatus Gracilibacteria bacterium]|nr:16S rRNA (cytosine(1402)-N(4))-methyltransferase RsmH [Candidatus Gracilibacteria bacterium]